MLPLHLPGWFFASPPVYDASLLLGLSGGAALPALARVPAMLRVKGRWLLVRGVRRVQMDTGRDLTITYLLKYLLTHILTY